VSIGKAQLQVLADHCLAAVDAMGSTLYRTAHSTFVKETEDFTTGLTTPQGQTFAAPKGFGSTWFVGLDYGKVITLIPSYAEGDICITSDPYSGHTCTHSPDIHLWKPVYHEGEIVAFAVGHIHNTDVGGAVPASLSRTLTEIHQEGIRIPPTKLFRQGELNTELVEVMLTNVRVRDQNWGDLKALVAAVNTGERQVHDMVAKFGVEAFRAGIRSLLDYSEAQTRALIRTIPDGEYYFQDYIDEDSVGGPPCRLAANMIVKDDSITLDFRTSDPQLNSSLNMPTGGFERHTLLLVGIYHAFYSLKPDMLLNTGMTRPFTCLLAEGSVLFPQFPAAVGMRSLTATRLQDVIFGCLSRALPDQMPAAPSGSISLMNVLTADPQTGRRVMASIDPLVGGGGGMPFADGSNGSGGNSGFLKNTPVEINEVEVPLRVLAYHLTPDSGGAGRYRGGLSTTLVFKVFAPHTVITARNRDRSLFQAWGVQGGRAGGASSYVVNEGTNREIVLANTDIFTAQPGDVIRITSSGGGGWGSPLDRPPAAVLEDVRQHFVTVEAAREDYAVIIVDGAVDEKATRLARAARHGEAAGDFDYGRHRVAFERAWSKENYDVLIERLRRRPVQWRHFLKQRVFQELAGRNEIDTDTVTATLNSIEAEFPQLGHLLATAE
jgi:N-methylhydantoinase B